MIISEQEREILDAMKKAMAPDPEIVRLRNERVLLQKMKRTIHFALSFSPSKRIKSGKNRICLISNLRGLTGDLSEPGFIAG